MIFCLFSAAAICGFWYQPKAFYALHFQYNDWAEYAEHYLRGKITLAACGHWNVLPTLAGHSLIQLIPAPETLFVWKLPDPRQKQISVQVQYVP